MPCLVHWSTSRCQSLTLSLAPSLSLCGKLVIATEVGLGPFFQLRFDTGCEARILGWTHRLVGLAVVERAEE